MAGEAANITIAPRAKYPKTETHSSEVPLSQPDRQVLPPLGEPLPDETSIEPVDRVDHRYADELAFMQEPMVIIITASAERHPTPCTDMVAVQGKWAEVWLLPNAELASSLSQMGSGRWHQFGYLPKGIPIVTKRCYVQELAKSVILNITANYTKSGPNAEPVNYLDRKPQRTAHFSVVEDRSPKAHAWLMASLS